MVVDNGQSVCRACSALNRSQVVFWWVFLVPKGGLLWNEDCWYLPFTGGWFVLLRAQRPCFVWPLRQNQGPAPNLRCCFLAAPPLPLHCLPSLTSNCWNLPFGAQGRSWRLESVPYKQGMEDTEKPCPEAPQGPAKFQLHITITDIIVMEIFGEHYQNVTQKHEVERILEKWHR